MSVRVARWLVIPAVLLGLAVVAFSTTEEPEKSAKRDQQVVTVPPGMKPVYETKTKVIQYQVNRPVWEARTKVINYTAMQPKWHKKAVYTLDGNGEIPAGAKPDSTRSICKMTPVKRSKEVTYKVCRMEAATREKEVTYQVVRFEPIN